MRASAEGSTIRYVAVEGPIGVGKTTLANRLAEDLGAELLLEGAGENPFLPRFYEKPRSHALATQLFFLMQRAEQLGRLRQADLFTPMHVADFMMEKDRLFAELTLDADEMLLYEQVHAHVTADFPPPDLVIYLQAPVKVLLRRISMRGFAYERHIDADYLQRLGEAYSRFFHSYESASLLIVNAAEIDLASSDEDYKQLLDQIGTVTPGRTFFDPLPL